MLLLKHHMKMQVWPVPGQMSCRTIPIITVVAGRPLLRRPPHKWTPRILHKHRRRLLMQRKGHPNIQMQPCKATASPSIVVLLVPAPMTQHHHHGTVIRKISRVGEKSKAALWMSQQRQGNGSIGHKRRIPKESRRIAQTRRTQGGHSPRRNGFCQKQRDALGLGMRKPFLE